MKQNTPSWLANAFIYDGYSQSILDTNGDEIGMSYVHGLVHWEDGFNRTGSRAPMQWSSAKNAGFSSAKAEDLRSKVMKTPLKDQTRYTGPRVSPAYVSAPREGSKPQWTHRESKLAINLASSRIHEAIVIHS